MVTKAAIVRQLILLSASICVIPLLLYPATLGLPQLHFHPLWLAVEWVFYFVVFLALLRTESIRKKITSAFITLAYRHLLGALLAVLVTAITNKALTQTLPHCLWVYTPAVLLQVAFAPFFLRSLFCRPWARVVRFAIDSGRQPVSRQESSAGFIYGGEPTSVSPKEETAGEVSFDAATAWVGDFSGVRLAAVIDDRGLLVSHWTRQTYTQDAEYWGAVAREIARFHQQWPGPAEATDLRRVDLETGSGRLNIRRAGPFWLVVLTEAETAGLVSVRITQAVEMVEKYYHDRYGSVQPAGREVAHV